MNNTRPNLTAPNGARLRLKLYSDDPGADEARDAAVEALLAAGFTATAEEPEDAPAKRQAAELSQAKSRVAELERSEAGRPDAHLDS